MSLETRIVALATQIGTDIKALRGNDGDLATLNTTAKTNLVAALNELKASLDAIDTSAVINDAAASLTQTYSSTKITGDIAAAIAALVDSAPTTLDTLNELAAALADNPNFASDIATALGERVSVGAAQTFTAPQKLQGRENIGAAADADLTALATAIGDTDQDFAADYVAARDA